MGRNPEAQALEHARLLDLALETLIARKSLQGQLGVGGRGAPVLAAEKGTVRGVGLEAIEDAPEGALKCR